MSHIFISYSRKDVQRAGKIVAALAENKLDTWIDWKSIAKGERWEQEIYRGIEEADAFLFLISPDSVISDMCNKEIEHALANNKRMLPVVIRDTELQDIHPEISKRNWIFCRSQRDNFGKAIREIRKTIRTDYGWVRYHTELQVKALKWEQKKDASRLLRGRELQEAEQQFAEINNEKDPQPTRLQREYLLISRRNEERQRRRITTGLSLGLVIVAVLAIFAWGQRNFAVASEATALTESRAKETALVNERYARATAQSEAYARGTAQVEAEIQRNAAVNRNLSLQGQYLLKVSQSSDSPMVASLLLLEAKMREPSFDHQPLLDALAMLARPIARVQHDDSVDVVAFSPNGQLVASGSLDGTVRVWSAETGQETLRLEHEKGVSEVAFSPDGRWLVSGSADHTVRVWNVVTGEEISRMMHDSVIYSAVFSPDSRWVVSGSADNTARVWDAMTGREISRMQHSLGVSGYKGVYSVAFSPNGQWVVSGGLDNTVRVWESATGRQISQMEHERGQSWVYLARFSPDGNRVVSTSRDRTIRVWDAMTGREVSRRELNSHRVNDFDISPDSRWIVSGGSNEVFVWDSTTGKEVYHVKNTLQAGWNLAVDSVEFSLDGRFGMAAWGDGSIQVWEAGTGRIISYMNLATPIRSAAFSPDARWVTAGGTNGTAQVFDLGNGSEITSLPYGYEVAVSPDGRWLVVGNPEGVLRVLEPDTGRELSRFDQGSPIWSVAVSPDGNRAASGSEDGLVRVWEIATGREISRIKHAQGVATVFFSPDGYRVISQGGYDEYMVRVWDAQTGQEISHMQQLGPSGRTIATRIAISPDGEWIAAGGMNGTVWVHEASSGQELLRLDFGNPIYSVDFSPDGKWVVVSGDDNVARLWNAATGEEISQMMHAGENVPLAAFTPHGKWVISSDSDVRVKAWDARTGQEIYQLKNESDVRRVAFSPDGRFMALGNRYGMVKVWDLETGLEISRLRHEDIIEALMFTADGRRVISASLDGILKVWLWNMPEEICARVSRNLTLAEWDEYLGDEPYHATCPNLPVPEE